MSVSVNGIRTPMQRLADAKAEIARLTVETDQLRMALAEVEALEEQHGAVIARLTAERDAALAARVRVKPLVWTDFGNISVAPDEGGNDDNLAVALCSYFDGWFDCPDEGEDAELDDYDCWKMWVSENAKNVLRRIATRANAVIESRILAALEPQPITVQDAERVPETDAERFDRADWYWRAMDPDDCGDTPSEAIHRGMIGDFCVCEIASSYTGPVRYGFNAPVLDPESDDREFLHFETQQEAIDAAKERMAALRAIAEQEGK